ncbi:uncharacterized protein LOC106132057 [Amyelois transitella]|uniref:uncharacterized protein LOC106132057 n=1 Tax=Amyelois transitella TaxID=680683 RepID=UPI00298F6E37|nr:uncharacterized protein LOC106132057 [Amyelois transitella]
MSEQEKKSGGGSTAPLVVVEQTTASRHKPIRADQEEATDLHRKHSKVPVVGIAEESKVSSAQDPECDHAMSTEKQKQSMSKKFSSVTSKRGPSMETITLAPMEIETKRDAPSSHQQPIPPSVEIVASHSDNQVEDKQETQLEKKADTDSITDEIKELRTPDATKKHSEWSDDEEAGGLPRSESRASRMSRAVRQLFCCGVRYEAASEDELSPRSGYATGI